MGTHWSPEQRRAAASQCPQADNCTPADRYQELFVAVQRDRVFEDSKTFVDCVPQADPEAILAAYRQECGQPGFVLAGFVGRWFRAPPSEAREYVSAAGRLLSAHIDALWPVLTREPRAHPLRGSLIALPRAYVVPGGRFMELYYWDAYFVMLGLARSGRRDLVEAMADNLAYLIDTFGRIPNANRTYYLSRSQPPLFAFIVELCESLGGPCARDFLPQLLREHAFWMDGADGLRAGEASRRVVALPDGELLNRYWDDRDTPREESWREDVATAAASGRPAGEVYRDLRAAAESGWDFSSRWLEEAPQGSPDVAPLSTIRTTRLLPVDLNAFLHKLETTIARVSRESGDGAAAEAFEARAQRRRSAIDMLMWNAGQGAYFDHDWCEGRKRQSLTAATLVPLFTGTSSAGQGRAVGDTVGRRLLAPGGLATTERFSGEQWDRPNGWAPLQWMAVRGLQAHGQDALAAEIRSRWLRTVGDVYRTQHKVVEKYALRELPQDSPRGGGGGEYPLQDGFGWTNGVTRQLLEAAEDVRCGA